MRRVTSAEDSGGSSFSSCARMFGDSSIDKAVLASGTGHVLGAGGARIVGVTIAVGRCVILACFTLIGRDALSRAVLAASATRLPSTRAACVAFASTRCCSFCATRLVAAILAASASVAASVAARVLAVALSANCRCRLSSALVRSFVSTARRATVDSRAAVSLAAAAVSQVCIAAMRAAAAPL